MVASITTILPGCTAHETHLSILRGSLVESLQIFLELLPRAQALEAQCFERGCQLGAVGRRQRAERWQIAASELELPQLLGEA